ncbi:helicase-related protein [Mycobacteroides abscessus]|uniref:helicase-related protein n=1 Tax=Mycobacteriaceae TaxID=1762 RepID=UPI0009A83405|nr:helicase-related protein [Mycobacteroides abscessus]MDM2496751.1 helicase-related protein [Mycobacteroides abscessus]MDM2516218.1 helicase-related protein [Mycobacteroides abscessus]MDM2525723.1 helicase-related protein [Mycobacteroides abscessus]MDM2535176.1 helicase-related protein [Mycobacteroides abscessus]MDM2714827.1 helicase-related protein [Mycobacteroides abscessus]
MLLEELKPGLRIDGLIPAQVITVIFAQWHGTDALELTYKTNDGALGQQVVFRKDQDNLTVAQTGSRAFDANATDFKMVAEAQRITLAGLFDPMLAVATSDVRPLPHQIRAVYGELLPRTPLRFLLADDPGAGKTIMAGLYIKELLLRDDVRQCLIVAPGGLVEQWQDELFFKFGLRFDLLTNQLIDANVNLNVFESNPLLIARMDQLSRNEELQAQLKETEWDLIIVDEAHRMGAHYFGGKLEKTKRFLLGEMLGRITRHLLLMTATPHSGKEEDFQLFLTLLDRDRFEGKNTKTANTDGIMRRMVKEDLLTFEGRKLFPERRAETVPYELTELEYSLYEQVTAYVREGMNRADRVGGKRKNTVGFALTVLQRRLASSPEAIYKSLVRRTERLERKKLEILNGTYTEREPTVDVEGLDADDYSSEQIEELEEELLDAATAAQTVEELDAELLELAELTTIAKQVRDSGTDRKWTELSHILQDEALTVDANGWPRKLIIFTEHRDTLDYLAGRIRTLIGKPNAVQAIHGGVRRRERRMITEEFTKNRDCQILLATDAAGEGLNLQAAHLMVNYDLPWNPNRIEQRFGRIHRIGQEEVCRLWNIVASNTREGDVFVRLLAKIEEQRKAYGGKVFDVLGEAFSETPLRELLLDAIRYGELPEVRAKMHEVIDHKVSDGLKELLDERALASDHLADADLAKLRAAMDEARARRLQPHYIELAFKAAFTRLGGRIAKRERGRYEIANVPAHIRASKFQPIATKYDRVTFDLEHVHSEDLARADLLAPGHPLHDAVMDEAIRHFGGTLNSGTVLVSATLEEPHLLVGVVEEVADATGAAVSRRFGYAHVDSLGTVTPAGPAPYLDCVAAPDTPAVATARQLPWLADAEDRANSWIITTQLPEYLSEVQPRRAAELAKCRDLVVKRLEAERDRMLLDAAVAAEKEQAGEKPRESAESLNRKAVELDARLRNRLELLDKQALMSTKPPRIVTAALVLPIAMVDGELPASAPIHAKETKEVERRGVDLVMSTERALGRTPVEQPFNNKGFDILSSDSGGDTYRIEVKARLDGAKDFFVTHNEVMVGKNAVPRYRLALVRVDPRGPDHDEVRYLDNPFASTDLGDFHSTGIRGDWAKMWAKGAQPF